MKYSNFDQVPAKALAGAEKDLLSKFVDGTIAFEEFTAYLKAPKSVRKEIAKLLKVYVPETIEHKLMNFGTIARSKSIPNYYKLILYIINYFDKSRQILHFSLFYI